jgi:hypothetical protein
MLKGSSMENSDLNWLPEGKRAAVCLSIDDVHPAKSSDHYEAGGDLQDGALGNVEWLLERHPQLRATLFVTADWREISPVPTRRILRRIPFLRDRFYLAEILPKGMMRLDRHPEFTKFLRSMPRTEIGLHGLHHVHPGLNLPVEFQTQHARDCRKILDQILEIFEAANLPHAGGMQPPGWNLTDALAEAMIGAGLQFVSSARDIVTPISPDAKTNQSGLAQVSLIYPELISGGRLLHLTNNFQATSDFQRAFQIIESGGLLAVKAHIVKNALGFVALDGLDKLYRNYLDLLFTKLEDDFGDSLWWTSMSEIAARVLQNQKYD